MEIKLIEFEFGMTQNLGDYSNTRPSVKLAAELAEGEDVDIALESLTATAVQAVHGLVDDELELAGRRVKYHEGLLFQVYYSEIRGAILISPMYAELPKESNWRHQDSWHKASHDYPSEMRQAAARRAAEARALKTGYSIYQSADDLPALPDAGPEPAWHAKKLEQAFRNLGLNYEEVWEELGELDHVTADYLRQLYSSDAERKLNQEDLIALIRSGQPFGQSAPEPEDEYDEDEEDEEEDEDDIAF